MDIIWCVAFIQFQLSRLATGILENREFYHIHFPDTSSALQKVKSK